MSFVLASVMSWLMVLSLIFNAFRPIMEKHLRELDFVFGRWLSRKLLRLIMLMCQQILFASSRLLRAYAGSRLRSGFIGAMSILVGLIMQLVGTVIE